MRRLCSPEIHYDVVRAIMAWLLAVTAIVASGCATEPKTPAPPTVAELRVAQQVGGAHYCTLVHGGAWYQGFGRDLLVLEPRSARLLETVELGRAGESTPLTTMTAIGDRLYAVLDGQEVFELSLSDPPRPRILERASAESLGVKPRVLSMVRGELYVSGEGGVVRWSDRERVFITSDAAGRVADGADGLVVCVGRRLYRVDDGAFTGSASDLLPAELDGVDPGTLVFSRQGDRGALLGLMNPSLRELDSRNLTVAVPGVVRRVRVFQHRIWAVTDEEISVYAIFEGALRRVRRIDVLGARDLGPLDENHLAVAGTFGRAIYRMRSTDRGPGDTFLYGHREPSRLTRARSDGRYILAGSEEGHWLYLIGSRVQLSDLEIEADDPSIAPPRQASTMSATAALSEDGRSLRLSGESGETQHREQDGAVLHCVLAVESEFWIGHDHGITVLKADGSADRLRLDGPVRYLFPLRVERGVAFVAEYGGFGIARYVEVPAAGPLRAR